MEAKRDDLHGNAPDSSPVVLVIIDLINDLEFPNGADFLKPTLALAKRVAALKKKVKASGMAVIYTNDNFGRWRSDFREMIDHCLNDDVRGKPLVKLLHPDPKDYFVLKPKNSAFFATTFDTLLTYLGAKTLILTGISADSCVLFTANDAYLRDYKLVIPEDCVTSANPTHTKQTLVYLRRVLKADTTPSTELDWDTLLRENQVETPAT